MITAPYNHAAAQRERYWQRRTYSRCITGCGRLGKLRTDGTRGSRCLQCAQTWTQYILQLRKAQSK